MEFYQVRTVSVLVIMFLAGIRSQCSLPVDYPVECVHASLLIADNAVQNLHANDDDRVKTPKLESIIDIVETYCNPQCIEPIQDYYSCIGLSIPLAIILCSTDGDEYCYGRALPLPKVPQWCLWHSQCSDTCSSHFAAYAYGMGCCLSTYIDGGAFPDNFTAIMSSCGVSEVQPCRQRPSGITIM